MSMSMTRAGIVRVGPLDKLWFRCLYCGKQWSPDIQPGGRRPRRWWQCPNGCNQNAMEAPPGWTKLWPK